MISNITPVILAAGDSSRIGWPKALLPLGADTFLTSIIKTLSPFGLPDARVVLGTHAPQIRPLLQPYQVRTLVNPDPSRGQSSSMILALESLDCDCQACLIWPVDHPLVSADLVRALIQAFLSSAAPLTLPLCAGRPGHPVIFGRRLITELLAAPRDLSPKSLIARYRSEAACVSTEERSVIEDIDTPADYLRIVGESLEAALARESAAERR